MTTVTFQRHDGNRENVKAFVPGAHEATIKRVSMKKTKKTNEDMFVILVAGEDGETGFFNLVFNEFISENINLILTSIQDNGEEIPEMGFGYDKATADFFKDKAVYIKVKNELYEGKQTPTIKTFLNQEEFDFMEEEDEEEEDDE
jgi:hypothetical protein